MQQCIKADYSNLHKQNHYYGLGWKRHNLVHLVIENNTILRRIKKKIQLMFSSYSFKSYVVETCFADLTVIKPIIVNSWFNHYKHNEWSMIHEAVGVYQVIWYQEISIVQD